MMLLALSSAVPIISASFLAFCQQQALQVTGTAISSDHYSDNYTMMIVATGAPPYLVFIVQIQQYKFSCFEKSVKFFYLFVAIIFMKTQISISSRTEEISPGRNPRLARYPYRRRIFLFVQFCSRTASLFYGAPQHHPLVRFLQAAHLLPRFRGSLPVNSFCIKLLKDLLPAFFMNTICNIIQCISAVIDISIAFT